MDNRRIGQVVGITIGLTLACCFLVLVIAGTIRLADWIMP